MRFHDRAEAGIRLGDRLSRWAGLRDVIVLAIPRGGVPVAFEVADRLIAPLDIFIVQRLALPAREHLSLGVIGSGGVLALDADVVNALRVPDAIVRRIVVREAAELERRERAYRGDRPLPAITSWTAILVDDGLAAGSTVRAAVTCLRRLGPARIVVALPIASPETVADLHCETDEVVCATTPQSLLTSGSGYADLRPVSDRLIRDLLAAADRRRRLVA